jgi:RNA polymerase sigma factor (sigma-70 family)
MAGDHLNGFLRQLSRAMAAATLEGLADQELAERFLAGRDPAVFAAVVQRHGPMVYRVCWRVLQQEQDAEDAFQVTFLLLARNLQTVRKQASLASWLHGVAYRVALKARTQIARRRRQEPYITPPKPPDDVTWGELRTVLDAELAALPEQQRLPLLLCYLEGRTQDEAARHLGWSTRTLRRRLNAAREALARRLRRRGVGPAALAAWLLTDCLGSAALSSTLIDVTVRAGTSEPAAVSPAVQTLLQGVRIAMPLTRFPILAAVLAAGLLLVGGWAAHEAWASSASVNIPYGTGSAAPQEPGVKDAEPLIAALSNDDIAWDHRDFRTLTPRVRGKAAQALLTQGHKAGPALVRALDDPHKFAAAHVLLTMILKEDFPSMPSLLVNDATLGQWNHLRVSFRGQEIDFHADQRHELKRFWQSKWPVTLVPTGVRSLPSLQTPRLSAGVELRVPVPLSVEFTPQSLPVRIEGRALVEGKPLLPKDDPVLQALGHRLGQPDRVTGNGRLFLQYDLPDGRTLTLIVSHGEVIGFDYKVKGRPVEVQSSKDEEKYVAIAAIDPQWAQQVRQLLEDAGIPSLVEGSVAYHVSVPPGKKAQALQLLKGHAAKHGYWAKF